LINRAVPTDELDQVVEQYAGRLCDLSAPALRLCKRALRLGADGWANLPAVEKLYLDELMASADAREGVAAFIEKRSPTWRHR
jgi:enoyl-CoA hydratase/carnithine racemase